MNIVQEIPAHHFSFCTSGQSLVPVGWLYTGKSASFRPGPCATDNYLKCRQNCFFQIPHRPRLCMRNISRGVCYCFNKLHHMEKSLNIKWWYLVKDHGPINQELNISNMIDTKKKMLFKVILKRCESNKFFIIPIQPLKVLINRPN